MAWQTTPSVLRRCEQAHTDTRFAQRSNTASNQRVCMQAQLAQHASVNNHSNRCCDQSCRDSRPSKSIALPVWQMTAIACQWHYTPSQRSPAAQHAPHEPDQPLQSTSTFAQPNMCAGKGRCIPTSPCAQAPLEAAPALATGWDKKHRTVGLQHAAGCAMLETPRSTYRMQPPPQPLIRTTAAVLVTDPSQGPKHDAELQCNSAMRCQAQTTHTPC